LTPGFSSRITGNTAQCVAGRATGRARLLDPHLVYERRGTDAGTFQLVNNGAKVLSHESFHDFNTDFGDIFLTATFVAVNGKVLVDLYIGRNLPPDGC
jgi:hypothetical protein